MKKFNNYCFPVFAVFLFVGTALMMRAINDMDEVWNYNFGYNICNGLIPYVDFNCIVTPLSFYLSAAFLNVFGTGLFAFRFLGIILLALTFYLLFCILLRCGGNKVLAFVGSSFLFSLCYLAWIYNYNTLNLLFILLALYLELRIETHKNSPLLWQYIVAGLVYGAMVVTKQTVGGLLLVYNGLVCLLCWIKHREMRIFYGLRFISSLLFPVAFLCYLFLTNSFAGFWDYAVAGIGTFTHQITYWQFITGSALLGGIGLIPPIITIISLYTILKNKSSISRRFHILALCTSWIGMSVAYPLCDFAHMSIAIVPFAVCGFCCISKVSIKTMERWVCLLCACFVLFVAAIMEMQKMNEHEICTLSNFQGLPISGDLQTHIDEVDTFILAQQQHGTEVLVVDSYAAIYYLPLNIYHKDFSLLNAGNIGSQSTEQLLDRENTIYLLFQNRSNLNQQNYFELINFITAHYSKIGDVAGYDIYQRK